MPSTPSAPTRYLSATDLLVDALAAYRITRLITTDEIFRPYRERIITAAREKKQEQAAAPPSPTAFTSPTEPTTTTTSPSSFFSHYHVPDWYHTNITSHANAAEVYRGAAYLVTCDYCTSVYAAASLSLLRAILPAARSDAKRLRPGAMLRTARYALAVAGAVSAYRELIDR